MERKEIVLKLAQIRTEKNISARELSLRLDKSHNYINEMEKGKNNISLEMFLLLCKELGVNPKDLF
ncbi:MAG: helix-turn-helix domain-containing protein [Firmicutes bacterium]|nr:helix-turn-helix domain-containing protein [Bacillota bacterium]